MVWVKRDGSGALSGVFANEQPGYAEEQLDSTDPDVVAFLNPTTVQTVLSQDLIAHFTVADFTAIKTAIDASDPLGLLWAQLQAQKDPMHVNHARFLTGWNALVQVLGQPRMTVIALALGVTIA